MSYEEYARAILDAPSPAVREMYLAEAARSGRFDAREMDRLAKVCGEMA